jgi:hypothetical protein
MHSTIHLLIVGTRIVATILGGDVVEYNRVDAVQYDMTLSVR